MVKTTDLTLNEAQREIFCDIMGWDVATDFESWTVKPENAEKVFLQAHARHNSACAKHGKLIAQLCRFWAEQEND